MITVLVVDDHEVVRLGLQALLDLQPDFRVVGQAGNAEEAVAAVERLEPMVDSKLSGASSAWSYQKTVPIIYRLYGVNFPGSLRIKILMPNS